jgi:TonB-dependent SusC/RagA subfamily outer membrane receptor
VNVLKGNSATALYGEKGKNGVILIKTKTQNAMQEIKVNGREKTTPQLVNADAASDKQQVLYIGVDNTITVEAANIDARDLNITVSQGTKTGGNGKFIVHFTKPGNVTISLFKNGSSAILKSFDFQVKPVPDPVNGKLPMYISSNYHLVADMEKESFENADSKSREGNSNIVFTKVETDPEFPGGVAAWRKYLEKNVNSSLPVSEGWKPGIYKIVVSFIVNADGSVRNIETDSYKGSKTAQHCIDLIKNAPKWQPAVQNGRKVNAYKKQPITFVIEDEPAGKTEPGVYSVPFKVHLMYDGRENVFAMVGNGTYTVKQGQLFYLNGKIANPKRAITGSNVSKMESYDEETGKKYFGVKGKSGVLRITTKG